MLNGKRAEAATGDNSRLTAKFDTSQWARRSPLRAAANAAYGDFAPFSRSELRVRVRPECSRDLAPRATAQLAQQVLDVGVGGPLGDHQLYRDLAIGQSFGEQPSHLAFSTRQAPR